MCELVATSPKRLNSWSAWPSVGSSIKRALREEIDSRLAAKEIAEHKGNLEVMRAALGEDAFRSAWACGRAFELEQTLHYAANENHEG